MMPVCRFCGAQLEESVFPFDCPLCGRHNVADRAPGRLEWGGGAFSWTADALRLPFASVVIVAPRQRALLREDGRDVLLDEGGHSIYPADPDAVRVAFFSTDWRGMAHSFPRVLSWPDEKWELRVDFSLEAHIARSDAVANQLPFEPGLEARITGSIIHALDEALSAALAALAPLVGESREALSARIDAALAGIDDESVNRRLTEESGLEVRHVAARRTVLAVEDPNGEPCPACGRRNARTDGVNAACAFCGERLFWCPNCLRHVRRRDDLWCPACGGRLYA